MITAEEKRGAKLTVRRMQKITRRSWSDIMDDHAKQMLDDVVARSKADSDGLGLKAIQSGSEQK